MKNSVKKIISTLLFGILAFSSLNLSVSAVGNEIYVSKKGSDTGDGSIENPFYTTEKAKEAAQASSASVIMIEEGVYSVSDMSFDASDGNVTYKGIGDVTLTEARELDVSDFKLVKNPDILKRLRPEAWGKVYELSLGEYASDISGVQLFVNGKKQNVSRYPNRSDSQAAGNTEEFPYMTAKNPAISGDDVTTQKVYDNTFTVSDDRIFAWEDLTDAYMIGSVVADYDWRRREINHISADGVITASDYVRDKTELYVCNLIEETDVVGEYAYTSGNKMLYAYLPENFDSACVVFQKTQNPLITIENAENITFENIKFDKISRTVFKTEASDGFTVKNCEFNYIDGEFVINVDGKNMNFDSNKVYGCSGGFIRFSGGGLSATEDAFINGNISIKNNLISNCGDEAFRGHTISCGTNDPQYITDSVGNSIENNVIYNCGGTGAIGVAGNDIIVKNNEVFNVVRHVHDGGAIYVGKSNVKAGNEIINNYVHTLNKDLNFFGLYSDDGQAGLTVKNNVVYDMRFGMNIGIGMNDDFSDNMFVDIEKSAMIFGERMHWTWARIYSSTPDEDGYSYTKYGKKVFTFLGETKRAVENYPNAYAKYGYLAEALERKPFFAPWNTKVNGNIHFSNSSSATMGYDDGFYHTYLGSDGKPLIEFEDEWLEKSGKKSEALTADGRINEIALYGGELKNNQKLSYNKADFYDYDNQNFNLTIASPTGSSVKNIDMTSIGLTDDSLYSEDFSFDFTPSYSDGKLKIVLDKGRLLSKYNISLIKDESVVASEEYFDDNADTAYETKNVTEGETYEIEVTGTSLARQKKGSYTVKKSFTVPVANDKSALSYITDILKREAEKYDNGNYVYNDASVATSMKAFISSATELISSDTATQTEVKSKQEEGLEILSALNAARSVIKAEISTCELIKTEAKVKVKAEDFKPYSQVSVVVTNPK